MSQEEVNQGEAPVEPQDPEYQLEEHISFKHNQETLNRFLKQLIEPNLSEFSRTMDGTNYAYVKLSLQNKGIQQINEIICQYPHLRYFVTIDLSFNQIKDVSYLQKLQYVVSLNLKRNLIEDIMFLQVAEDFRYLKHLNLEGNKIKTLSAIELRNLESLNMNFNQIYSLVEFESHPKLKKVELRGNKIADLKGLGKMKALQELYLAENSLESFKGLTDLPALQKLHARKNKIENLTQFPDLPKLKYLNLRENQIKTVDSLSGIVHSVETLNLLGCPLSEQQGDNTKKEVWMKFRHYQKINKTEVGFEEKEEFDKEYKERLAEQERERLEKEAAQREEREAREAAEREEREAREAAEKE